MLTYIQRMLTYLMSFFVRTPNTNENPKESAVTPKEPQELEFDALCFGPMHTENGEFFWASAGKISIIVCKLRDEKHVCLQVFDRPTQDPKELNGVMATHEFKLTNKIGSAIGIPQGIPLSVLAVKMATFDFNDAAYSNMHKEGQLTHLDIKCANIEKVYIEKE